MAEISRAVADAAAAVAKALKRDHPSTGMIRAHAQHDGCWHSAFRGTRVQADGILDHAGKRLKRDGYKIVAEHEIPSHSGESTTVSVWMNGKEGHITTVLHKPGRGVGGRGYGAYVLGHHMADHLIPNTKEREAAGSHDSHAAAERAAIRGVHAANKDLPEGVEDLDKGA